jgi:hypothetical protein
LDQLAAGRHPSNSMADMAVKEWARFRFIKYFLMFPKGKKSNHLSAPNTTEYFLTLSTAAAHRQFFPRNGGLKDGVSLGVTALSRFKRNSARASKSATHFIFSS